MKRIVWMVCVMLAGVAVHAEQTHWYELEGFGAFLDGSPESTSVGEEGTVMLAPSVKELYADTEHHYTGGVRWGEEWVLSRAKDGVLVALDKQGKTRDLYTPSSGYVTAMAVVNQALWVALGPKGSVVKIDSKGHTEVVYTPKAEFVWSIVPSANGAVYMATGNPGTVVKWVSAQKQEVVFESRHTHLRALAYAPQTGFAVGSGDSGMVYHSSDGLVWKALYDSGMEETTSLVLDGNHVYVASASGADALALKRTKNDKERTVNVRSQVVQLDLRGRVFVLAGSSDEVVFDMVMSSSGTLYVATGTYSKDDPRGRLYAIKPSGHSIRLLHQSLSKQCMAVLGADAGSLTVLTGGVSRVLAVGTHFAKEGDFIGPVHDMGVNAQVGSVSVLGVWDAGSEVRTFVRTGYTQTPDKTWSEWVACGVGAEGKAASGTAGRFVQMKLHLKGSEKTSPQVQRVRVAYQRQNVAPFIREVTVLRKGLSLQVLPKEENKTKTVTLSDKVSVEDLKNPAIAKRRDVPRVRQTEDAESVSVRWSAEDSNDDVLVYTLAVRKQGDTVWRVLKEGLTEPFYVLRSSQLVDGYHQFQVRVSDAASNVFGEAQEDVHESRWYPIDNTPAVFSGIGVQREAQGWFLSVEARDTMGPLVDAEWMLDGGEAYPLMPVDGVLDTGHEMFKQNIGVLSAGSHTLTVRVTDEAGNVSFGQHVWVVP